MSEHGPADPAHWSDAMWDDFASGHEFTGPGVFGAGCVCGFYVEGIDPDPVWAAMSAHDCRCDQRRVPWWRRLRDRLSRWALTG